MSTSAPTPPGSPTREPQKTFYFFSSCPEPWGGSEELWAGAAEELQKRGHRVLACKTYVSYDHFRIKQLETAGIPVHEYFLKFRRPSIRRTLNRILPNRYNFPTRNRLQELWIRRIRESKVDLVIVCQSANHDGLAAADICIQAGVPYVVIVQKASDHDWPGDATRNLMREAFTKALKSYFVSEHNQQLTENQIGCHIPNSSVVRNPFKILSADPLPYPVPADGIYRLACLARMNVFDKGQDILLNVLASEKWKQRPLHVHFFGKGMHHEGLEGMAKHLGVANAHFMGFTNYVTEVWKEHQALVLPSRAEGLPLVLIEAMLSGRVPIITDAGGSAEVVDDGVTGFLAEAANMVSLDNALERAWARRGEWGEMGKLASQRVQQMVPLNPCSSFATELESIAMHATKHNSGS